MASDEELRAIAVAAAYKIREQLYRTRPLIWYEQRFKGDPKLIRWSLDECYEGWDYDGTKDPLYEIWKSIADGNRKTAVNSSTGIGKTFILSIISYWYLDCWKGSTVVAAGPTATQLRDGYWSEMRNHFAKFKKLHPYSVLLHNRLKVSDVPIKELDDNDEEGVGKWGVISRSGVLEGGAGQDKNTQAKSQGIHNTDLLIIVDEAAGVSSGLIKIFESTVGSEHNQMLLVGNPDGKNDGLQRFARKAGCNVIQASSYDHLNIVKGSEVIGGAITKSLVKEFRDDWGEESAFYKSRIRGIVPDQLSNSLIKEEWVRQCVDNKIEPDGSKNALGIDVANSELGDKATAVYGMGNKMLFAKLFKCANANDIAYNVLYGEDYCLSHGYNCYGIPMMDEYNINARSIGIDSVGVGVATLNTFLNEGYAAMGLSGGQNATLIPKDPRGKPKYSFNSLRSQMLWMLREDLRNGLINIQIEPELVDMFIEEVTSIQYERNGNKISMEKKDLLKKRLGRSPDLLDGIMYWNYIRQASKVTGGTWDIE